VIEVERTLPPYISVGLPTIPARPGLDDRIKGDTS
jgi:hypothetical protein